MMKLSLRSIAVMSAAIAVAGTLFASSAAYAQRNAGAKIRGEFGSDRWFTSDYSNGYNRGGSSYYTAPAPSYYSAPQQQAETRQSYSYDPAPPAPATEGSMNSTQAMPYAGTYQGTPNYNYYAPRACPPNRQPWQMQRMYRQGF